jgi:hypothetical protein
MQGKDILNESEKASVEGQSLMDQMRKAAFRSYLKQQEQQAQPIEKTDKLAGENLMDLMRKAAFRSVYEQQEQEAINADNKDEFISMESDTSKNISMAK